MNSPAGDSLCDVDILIIGSGFVGSALALALANCPFRVGIVEARTGLPHADTRGLALSLSSWHILQELKLTAALTEFATPIHEVQVSSEGHFGVAHFRSTDYAVPALGYVTSASVLQSQLEAAAHRIEGLTWFCPSRAVAAVRTDLGYRVELQGERQGFVHTRLLVVADGAQSQLRDQLGFSLHRQDYHQTALIATLTLAQPLPSHKIAYERCTARGALAALPLQPNRYAMIWVQDREQAGEAAAWSDSEWLSALQQAWGYRLGRLVSVSDRRSYELESRIAKPQITAGAVLLGNAAHTLHPVAAQGLNLSLRDMRALAQVIGHTLDRGDAFSLSVLQRYQQLRFRDQTQTTALTGALARGLSPSGSLWSQARALGIAGLEFCTPIRQWIGRRAMGF